MKGLFFSRKNEYVLARRLVYLVLAAIFFFPFSSCHYGQYRPHSQLNQLEIGMPSAQVVTIMGQPKQIKPLSGGGSSYRYDLFTPFRGLEPYDLTFDTSGRLIGYSRDNEEYYRMQQNMQAGANSFVQQMQKDRQLEQKDRELDIKQQEADRRPIVQFQTPPTVYVHVKNDN